MTTQDMHSSYLLVDGSQLTVAAIPMPTPDDRPAWLTHIYDGKVVCVSPFVIDIEAADVAGACEQITGLANAIRPQLHASLIDTVLSHAELVHHLRRFIMIRSAEGKAYTLRFADCTVLPILSEVLAPAQWTSLVGPIARWCVHGLDGALLTLPPGDDTLAPEPTPLVLSDEQLAALSEATAPSMVLAYLLDTNHGVALPGSFAEQHRWASDARRLWRASGNTDDIVLRWLTRAALDTHGRVLQQRSLPTLLGGPDLGAIRAGLLEAVNEHSPRAQKTLA